MGIVPTESLVTICKATDESLVAMAKAVPLGRLGDPTDVAAAVVFLSASSGEWITGQTLVVTGGH